jgi:hypothetical protein
MTAAILAAFPIVQTVPFVLPIKRATWPVALRAIFYVTVGHIVAARGLRVMGLGQEHNVYKSNYV